MYIQINPIYTYTYVKHMAHYENIYDIRFTYIYIYIWERVSDRKRDTKDAENINLFR